MIRPNWTPWRAPWKSDNYGYYNKPGWATKPPVPWGAKFRKDELRWAEDSFGGTRVRHAVPDDFFNRYPQGYAYSKYLRVKRTPRWASSRPRSLGNGSRPLRCYFCGRIGHIMRYCYRARRAGQA